MSDNIIDEEKTLPKSKVSMTQNVEVALYNSYYGDWGQSLSF
jgi:hypothetical protein